MKETHTITHSCGHTIEREIAWDGRRKSSNEWLVADEAIRLGVGTSAGFYDVHPRAFAEIRVERAHSPNEPCWGCYVRASQEKLIEQLGRWAEKVSPFNDSDIIGVVAERIRRLEGEGQTIINVEQSDRSEAIYITLVSGERIRVASHPPVYESSKNCQQVIV